MSAASDEQVERAQSLLTEQAKLDRISLRQLLLVTELAQLGSLREAAAALYISQPAASNLLRNLEETVGTELFDRHRRGMTPNSCGAVLIRHARIVLSTLGQATQDVAAVAAGARGHIRLGVVMGATPLVIPRTIAEVKRDRSALIISVEVDTSDRLVTALERGDMDFIIARPPGIDSDRLISYEPLFDEPLVVVARHAHPLASAEFPLDLKSLGHWQWILFAPGAPMRAALAPLFQEHTPGALTQTVESSSIILTTSLLEQTDMLAVLPEDVARYYEDRGILSILPVPLPPLMGSYGIITRPDRPLQPAALIFLDVLRQVSRELAARADGPPADQPAATSGEAAIP